MTITALIMAILGAFTAFCDCSPVYNVLGVLMLCLGLKWFIRLAFHGKESRIYVFIRGKVAEGNTPRTTPASQGFAG